MAGSARINRAPSAAAMRAVFFRRLIMVRAA
jgi:hypothetical protein